MNRIRCRSLIALSLALAAGCASEADDPDSMAPVTPTGAMPGPATSPSTTGTTPTPAPTSSYVPTAGCEDVVGTIFAHPDKCGGALCHGGPGTTPPYLNLGDPVGLRERLVDVKGEYCTELSLIDSVNPELSALVEKLKPIPSCGMRMPSGRDLEPADLNCILEWVQATARGDI